MKIKLFFIICYGLSFSLSFGSPSPLPVRQAGSEREGRVRLGEAANGDTTHTKRIRFAALPIIYYQPETKWGAGAAGLFRFKQKTEPDSMRHSNIMFSLVGTQLAQILIGIPFQMWFNREAYNVYGEVGFQSVNYLFFGIGNHVPSYFRERYFTNNPRLRLTALRRVYPHLYAGLKYSYDYTNITQLSDTGMLIKGTIAGSKGGAVSGVGTTIKYDNRDNQFYATKGYYAEFFALTNNNLTGSDYSFGKYSLDVSTYCALPYKQVLAFNGYGVINTGNVPFYQMAVLGGDSKMRGLYQGRFRDKDCWVLQTEYRAHLFWRLGAVAFASIGDVAPQLNQFNYKYTHLAFGGGLRVLADKKQRLNLRFDTGYSNNQVNYYFTLGEAF
ncbi:MAG: BamA/TamA family outer membrane protein [Bacteroidia bacterium]